MYKSQRLIAAAGVSLLAALIVPATTAAASGPPLYKSTVALSTVGNLPSVGGEAYAFSEFGNEVGLTGVNLGKVVVTMSTWACQTGSWNLGNCGTTPGATFTEPITFNIYAPPAFGSATPGNLIATRTATFTIPYRPSANYTHCTGANAGKWWDSLLAKCLNGKVVNIAFTFGVTLPSTDVVFGIAYNTTHYGYNPIGQDAPCYTASGGCPYDSLNIALTQDPTNVTAGSDRYPGTVYQNAIASEYCDQGAAGAGFFRLDSPASPSCWGVNAPYTSSPFYIPAVLFKHA